MRRKETTEEKDAAFLGRAILWATRNKGILGIGALAYVLGNGSGSVATNMFGGDKVFQDSVLKRLTNMETKVDKVLVAAKVYGGSFLELRDGPRALKEYRRKEKTKREQAEPFGISMDVEDPQLQLESPKPIAQGKPRAERVQ